MSLKIPTWPRERDLATYSQYTCIRFDHALLHGKIWMDIGCRTGKAMSETKGLYKTRLIGVNAHQIEVLPGIESIFAEIPQDRSVYKRFRKKIDFLTDVYGAFTYDNDPIGALIYEACLLAPNGKAAIITMEARLGNKVNRQDLEHFFEKILGQKITFKRFRTYSDNSKRPLSSLRITITGCCRSTCKLESLLLKARQMIGEPRKTKLLYTPPDKSVELWKIIYQKTRM